MKIKDVGEFGLIERIQKRVKCGRGVVLGIGDDTAVLRVPGRSKVSLLTVDNLIEGIHFHPDTDATLVGQKSLARSLSDIAAMGGVPKYTTLALGVSRERSIKYIDRFYDGFLNLAREFGVDLVGGDVSRMRDGFFASVAILGEVGKNQFILRKKAKVGDLLFVTGSLGGSISGKHLRFRPRIAEGQWLAKNRIPSAMLDISDGLVGDLGHLLKASRVGAYLSASKIPISRAARLLSNQGGITALERALSDGEDYELLFTSSSRDISWMKDFKRLFGLDVTCVGQIIQQAKIYLEDKDGDREELKAKGYTHF